MRRVVLSALLGFVLVAPTLPLVAQSGSPTEAYTAYRQALATATTYDELLPFMEQSGRAVIEAMPADRRAVMFGLMKRFADTFTDISVTGERVTGDTATLTLAGKDPKGQPATGSVPMTRQDGVWKVGTEKWSSKPR